MAKYPVPDNEKQRLQALYSYEILDSIGEEDFDRITELASIICQTPIALVSLVDQDRQWFKSRIGLDISETSRGFAFCNYTILNDVIFEVEDAQSVTQFQDSELVTGSPNIRFYAGFPLTDPAGYALGSLCVMGSEPKKLTPQQRRALELLAKEVVAAIVERRQKEELRHLERLFKFSKDIICVFTQDGVVKKINPAFESILGWGMDELSEKLFCELFHPDDLPFAQAKVGQLTKSADTVTFEVRCYTQAQEPRLIQWVATPEPGTDNVFAIGRDVTLEKQREQELAASEEKMRTFFENSQGLMCTYDTQGIILTVNKAFASALGYTQQELLTQNVCDIVVGGKPAIDAHIAQLREKGHTKGQVTVWRKDRQQLVLLYNDAFVQTFDGNGYVIGNSTDITEKYELEQKLHHSQEMLEQTSRIARIGGWEYNVSTSQLYWSGVMKEIYGVPQDFQPDSDIAAGFYTQENREWIARMVSDAIAGNGSWDVETQIVTLQGKEKWVRAIGNVERRNDRVIRVYGTLQDIHEKKSAEIKLKKSQKLLADVLDSATEVGIIATDASGTLTVFNKGAEKLLGQFAVDVIGRNVMRVLHFVKDEIRSRAAELSRELEHPVKGFQVFIAKSELLGSEVREWTYRREDGNTLTIEMAVTTIKDDKQNVAGYLAVATNVSELKRAKADLEKLTHHLQNKNKQLLNFAHITSHNLRSPVSNLNALVSFYNESESNEEKEMLYQKFEIVVNHLSQTLNELIEALKIQEDLTQITEPIQLEEVFQKVQEILAGQIMEAEAQVTYDFSKVPVIPYSKSYLESILLNLFSNSIKYRVPYRKPIIHFETDTQEGESILWVKDNGLGIDLARYGHKLFGLNKTFHRNPDAKGVGLFMTKMQVEAMGGSISAKSEVNKGTTFKIVFKKK